MRIATDVTSCWREARLSLMKAINYYKTRTIRNWKKRHYVILLINWKIFRKKTKVPESIIIQTILLLGQTILSSTCLLIQPVENQPYIGAPSERIKKPHRSVDPILDKRSVDCTGRKTDLPLTICRVEIKKCSPLKSAVYCLVVSNQNPLAWYDAMLIEPPIPDTCLIVNVQKIY